jgi:carbon storage regulator CsrA
LTLFASITSDLREDPGIGSSTNGTIGLNNGGSVMLILSRKSSESVAFGDPAGRDEHVLKITVLEISKRRVRLGFELGGDVPIHRWEVWHRIRSDIERDRLQTRLFPQEEE